MNSEPSMTDEAFREWLDFLMQCDPVVQIKVIDVANMVVRMKEIATTEASVRGYIDWIDAYHRHEV